jgi:predicted nucleic acid-binding Zn ribbon protein
MPIYLYQCPLCEYYREINIPYEQYNTYIANCPRCADEVDTLVRMKRIIADSPSIVFKGNGFYSTDNRVEKIPKKVKEHEYN